MAACRKLLLLGRDRGPPGRYARTAYIAEPVEWHRDKATANLRKRGVDFADAATVLTGDLALTRSDEDPDEERFVTLGVDALGRMLVVTHTWRSEEIRIISARTATASERTQYEKKR